MTNAKLTSGLNVSGNFLVTARLAGSKVSQFTGSKSLGVAGRNLSEMDTLRSNSIGGPTENERNRVV
ncbi:MAG: hypothetical protein RL068_1067 [Actinomycetota bacterium]|jgi:hypothetical protein